MKKIIKQTVGEDHALSLDFAGSEKRHGIVTVSQFCKAVSTMGKLISAVSKEATGQSHDVFISDAELRWKEGKPVYHIEFIPSPKGAKITAVREREKHETPNLDKIKKDGAL